MEQVVTTANALLRALLPVDWNDPAILRAVKDLRVALTAYEDKDLAGDNPYLGQHAHPHLYHGMTGRLVFQPDETPATNGAP